MKTRLFRVFLVFICAIGLTSCVSREQADAKLVKACAAGIDALNGEDREISRVIESETEPSPVGPDHRHVTMTVLETDHWVEENVVYECVFQETFGLFKQTHTAAIYQLRLGDGKIIGRSGAEIVGSTRDFMKLEDAIRGALYD